MQHAGLGSIGDEYAKQQPTPEQIEAFRRREAEASARSLRMWSIERAVSASPGRQSEEVVRYAAVIESYVKNGVPKSED